MSITPNATYVLISHNCNENGLLVAEVRDQKK
jgi:hypothetical protein